MAAQVSIKKQFICLSEDTFSKWGSRAVQAVLGLQGFAGCCVSEQRQSTDGERCAGRLNFLGRSCAWPGWGSQAHFHKHQIYCDITVNIFLLPEMGERSKQQHLAKQVLSTQLCKRCLPFTLVNMREKMVSSACNKAFQSQIAICQWYFSSFSFREESELVFFNLLIKFQLFTALDFPKKKKKIMLQPRQLFDQIGFLAFVSLH